MSEGEEDLIKKATKKTMVNIFIKSGENGCNGLGAKHSWSKYKALLIFK